MKAYLALGRFRAGAPFRPGSCMWSGTRQGTAADGEASGRAGGPRRRLLRGGCRPPRPPCRRAGRGPGRLRDEGARDRPLRRRRGRSSCAGTCSSVRRRRPTPRWACAGAGEVEAARALRRLRAVLVDAAPMRKKAHDRIDDAPGGAAPRGRLRGPLAGDPGPASRGGGPDRGRGSGAAPGRTPGHARARAPGPAVSLAGAPPRPGPRRCAPRPARAGGRRRGPRLPAAGPRHRVRVERVPASPAGATGLALGSPVRSPRPPPSIAPGCSSRAALPAPDLAYATGGGGPADRHARLPTAGGQPTLAGSDLSLTVMAVPGATDSTLVRKAAGHRRPPSRPSRSAAPGAGGSPGPRTRC